jgi:DNA mismatch repair ATPase MutS
MSGVKKMTVKILSEEFYKLKDEIKELEPLKKKMIELEKKYNSVRETMKTQQTVIKACEQKIEGLQKMVICNQNEGLSFKKGESEENQSIYRNKCKKFDDTFENKNEWKKHMKEKHQKKIDCNICELTFNSCIDLEVHLKIHGKPKDFKCDICGQEFYLNWRLKKHQEGHTKNLKHCHYFNNNLICPYEENGCMYIHKVSPVCIFNSKCANKKCPFRHTDNERKKHMKEKHQKTRLIYYYVTAN